jgi:hypothetical protein
MMDISELKDLYTKLLEQDTLDLDGDGARYILQSLVEDEFVRLSEPCEWCEGNVSKYFDVNWYDFTTNNTGARPKAKFCPFCGRDV